MVAPVLAVLGGLGLLGARSLSVTRAAQRTAARANEPFQAALNSQLTGPALPAGQEGPTQSQAGFSQEQQSILIGLMQNGNAEAAFSQGQVFKERNIAARNLQIQEQNQAAGIAQQQQQHGLAERRFEFDVAGRLAETNEAARLREEARAGLLDPVLGAQQATGPEFANFDPATGVTTMIPKAGTVRSDAGRSRLAATTAALDTVTQLREDIAEFNPTGDPADPVARSIQARSALLLFNLKEGLKLGALDQGLIDAAAPLIPDSTGLVEQTLGSREAALATLAITAELLQRDSALALQETRLWPGISDERREQSLAIQARSRELDIQNRAALGQAGDVLQSNQTTIQNTEAERLRASSDRTLATLRQFGAGAAGLGSTAFGALAGFIGGRATR